MPATPPPPRNAPHPVTRPSTSSSALAFAAALSCGREAAGPDGGAIRYARGISFNAIFPGEVPGGPRFTEKVVPFTTVHVVLHHADGSIALDTVINFPSDANSVTLSLDVPLAAGAPASGEALTLTLAYINAAGQTVFSGGPISVTAVPTAPGTPAPVQVPVSVAFQARMG